MTTSRIMIWTAWLVASIFYAYQFVLRVMPNVMMDDLTRQFDMNALVFGQFCGVYYIGYSLLHLPVGIMLDRYGSRKVVTLCILMTVVGLLPLLFADHWLYPLLGRALMGIGSSAAILGSFKIIRLAFQEKHFARMLSLTVTIGLVGAIYGGGPMNYMCEAWGYQRVIQMLIVMGIVLATVAYVLLPCRDTHTPPKIGENLKHVFTNARVWIICCSAGLMVGPAEGFADVWASEFLKNVYHYNADLAGFLPSLIFSGMCFGAPVLGLIAEKTGRYISVIVGAGLMMAVLFGVLLLGVFTEATMTVGFVGIGVCCAYQILAIYKASTYVPETAVGLTTAVANMIIMSFGYAFHSIIGATVNACGGIANPQALTYGVAVIPIALLLGSVGFMGVASLKQ